MGKWMEAAKPVRAAMDAAAKTLTNAQASSMQALFYKPKDSWWAGQLVTTGTRIQWRGKLVAARNDLWATKSNNPDNAPALWETIEYRDGYRVLTEPISASNPVQPGEKCWENDVLYECVTVGVNTYRPSEYMANWKLANE